MQQVFASTWLSGDTRRQVLGCTCFLSLIVSLCIMNQHEPISSFCACSFLLPKPLRCLFSIVFSFTNPNHKIGVKWVILLADSKGKLLGSRVVCEARKITADAPGRVASLFWFFRLRPVFDFVLILDILITFRERIPQVILLARCKAKLYNFISQWRLPMAVKCQRMVGWGGWGGSGGWRQASRSGVLAPWGKVNLSEFFFRLRLFLP